MDINKMLADLRGERAQIEEAIMALERLTRAKAKGTDARLRGMTAGKRRG
jgi:hypothetical protein